MTSAPRALRMSIFSLDCLSVVVKMHLYPFTTPARARPMPVFPDVHSMIVPPGFNFPCFSATSTIFTAMRSLAEFPGLKYSTFASTVHGRSLVNWLRRMRGVFPIVSRMLFLIFICWRLCGKCIDFSTYICCPIQEGGVNMEPIYIKKIAEKLSFSLKQISNIYDLQAEGATIPFMARYRKEATGNMDEVQINDVVEQIKYFTELEKRKETVLKTIEGLGKLTPELKVRIVDCYDATVLEDIYLPYKPKRKTRATTAIEKGLEPLAKFLFEQGAGDPAEEAAKFVGEQVKDTKDALQGARDIIAEWISEH